MQQTGASNHSNGTKKRVRDIFMLDAHVSRPLLKYNTFRSQGEIKFLKVKDWTGKIHLRAPAVKGISAELT